MEKNVHIYFIIPLHKWDERVFRALDSIPNLSNIHPVIVTTEEIGQKIESVSKGRNLYIVSDNFESTSYQTLVNFGILHVKEIMDDDIDNFISILEYDDELYPNAIATFIKYHLANDSDVYAPLVSFVEDSKENEKPNLISFGNEACWAGGMSEEIGKFDFNMLLKMNFVFVNGCFFNIDCFDHGLFKPKIKVFYDYEFILRMVYSGLDIIGIPKLTHKHYMSPDGAMMTMVNTLSKEEREYWLSVSRKEYFFDTDEDRNIEYVG
jgi:hypothetical protein